MAMALLTFLVLLFGCIYATPVSEGVGVIQKAAGPQEVEQEKEDLKTAASTSHNRRYADWGNGYYSGGGYSGGGYNGYGVTGYGSLEDRYNSYNGLGYDNTYGYSSGSYPGYNSYNTGYGSAGYGGYNRGYGGYGSSGYGGYGGNGGNGGLNSYYGYNTPYYQGAGHQGYGYNQRRGYGNIYNNGVTPSLVTGYRGYSR